jgi:hypothetical protein
MAPRSPSSQSRPLSSRPRQAIVTAATLLMLCGGTSLAVWHAAPDLDGPKGILMEVPGIREPLAHSAADVQLADAAEVIGISVGGRVRAYLVDALNLPDRHVVNDLLGDTPITVTFCPRTDCVRVYSDPSSHEPLPIVLGGWMERYEDRTILLLVGTTRYRQDTGQPLEPGAAAPLSYPQINFVRTSWKEWRAAHPETDIYLGVESSGMPSAQVQ